MTNHTFKELRLINHTGRELQLMLENRKPLSMFYADADQKEDERIIPRKKFDRYVKLGRFQSAERTFEVAYDPRTKRPHRVKYVLYCLKGEEWRLKAMLLVLKISRCVTSYDEGLDRIESALLGYTDEEIEKLKRAIKRSSESKAV